MEEVLVMADESEFIFRNVFHLSITWSLSVVGMPGAQSFSEANAPTGSRKLCWSSSIPYLDREAGFKEYLSPIKMQGRGATTGMLLLLFATLFLSTCDGSYEREASPHTAATVMESALLSTGLKGAHKIQSHARLTEETVHEPTETSNITLRKLLF